MFKLELKTDGAAFCCPETGEKNEYYEAEEICRIFSGLQFDLRSGCTSGTIMDINGNKIGRWSR